MPSATVVSPSALRQADDGVHDRTPGGLAEVADEVPIDLEDVHRYAGELGQAGVAGAEVVERDLYPGLAQVPHRPVGPQDGELALGDLQGQPRWRKSVAGQHPGHRHREVVGELGGRGVDEQLRQVAALPLPARHLRDRLLELLAEELNATPACLPGDRRRLTYQVTAA